MRRYEIEVFYLRDIDEELIKLDNNGKFRTQIREYTLFKTSYSDIKELEKREEKQSVFYTDRKSLAHKKDMYAAILKKTGLLDSDKNLILDKPIHMSDLKDFVTYIKKNKQTLQRLFNTDIRTDINTKPVQQLNGYLKRLGITTKRTSKKTPDGGKDYYYTINPERLQTIEDIVNTRSDKATAQLWHTNRVATKEDRLFEPYESDYYMDEKYKQMIKESNGNDIEFNIDDESNDVYDEIIHQINNQYRNNSE